MLQPLQVEQLSPGTLGSLSGEKAIVEQSTEELTGYTSARSPVTISIVGLALVPIYPGVEQHITRTAVESAYRLAGMKQAKITEAAYVQYRSWTCCIAEYGFVERRYQRGSLPTCRYVTAAEISNDRDIGQFRDKRGVSDLNGEATLGLMSHGLPMTSDGPDG